jgi:hypothetical protein
MKQKTELTFGGNGDCTGYGANWKSSKPPGGSSDASAGNWKRRGPCWWTAAKGAWRVQVLIPGRMTEFRRHSVQKPYRP